MQVSRCSSTRCIFTKAAQRLPLTLALQLITATAIGLMLPSASWGQSVKSPQETAPKFTDNFLQQQRFSTSMDDLRRVDNESLAAIAQQLNSQPSPENSPTPPDPTPATVDSPPEGDIPVTPDASPDAASRDREVRLFLRLNPGFPNPTALQGSGRPSIVLPSSREALGPSIAVRSDLDLPGNGDFAAVLRGGPQVLAIDLGFTQANPNPLQGFSINFFNQRSWHPAFLGGEDEVDLEDDETAWVHRLGGGVEFFIPVAPEVNAVIGTSYQRVSVRDDMFSSDVFSTDEDGNAVTVDDDGIDDLLTINSGIIWDTKNDPLFPTQGFRARLGVDQGFTLGDETISFTRLSANYAQYIPLNLFGFTEGPRTLVANLQVGTLLGEVPPYEAFSMGGSNSVRGFGTGDLGTGRSFLLAALEYRYPIANFDLFSQPAQLRGNLFVDYGTTFGSQDDVIGEPGLARDKPGEGLGFGLGLHLQFSAFLGRIEFALNNEGGSALIFAVSDRF